MSSIVQFFWDQAYNLLYFFGFKKGAKVLFLGLDNSGKTTLLRLLKTDVISVHEPTHHTQQDDVEVEGIQFKAFDLGGHAAARRNWKNFFQKVDGVIFMVDSSDHFRFVESERELQYVLTCEELEGVPVAILGNKVDKSDAASEPDLRYALQLDNSLTGKATPRQEGVRPVELFMCSVVKKYGYTDAFKWLAKRIP